MLNRRKLLSFLPMSIFGISLAAKAQLDKKANVDINSRSSGGGVGVALSPSWYIHSYCDIVARSYEGYADSRSLREMIKEVPWGVAQEDIESNCVNILLRLAEFRRGNKGEL